MDTKTFKPAVIGGDSTISSQLTFAPQGSVEMTAVNGGVNSSAALTFSLDPVQQQLVQKKLDGINFLNLKRMEIATLGSDAEVALHQTLNGFLSRISSVESPKLFKLLQELNKAVEKEELDKLADNILNAHPGFFEKIKGLVFSKQQRDDAARRAWEEIVRLAQGKTKNLVDIINQMERDLKIEQGKLSNEISSMENLKAAYREQFGNFVIAVVFTRQLLEKARQEVAEFERTIDPSSPLGAADLEEQRGKLQDLESRSLALEGTMTKLPADHMVLRQLQAAGISTLTETVTTASGRFANIKMTLLALQGALSVRGVQQLAGQGAALNANLDAVRAKLTKDVVVSAANAPGDNRVKQAEQITKLIKDTKELDALVKQAEQTNKEKFTQAREMFAQAQQEMLALSNR